LQKVNLPITISSKIDYQDFIDAMSVDKKAIGGEVRLVLMKKMGQAFIKKAFKFGVCALVCVLFHTFQHFLQVRNTGADHDIIVVHSSKCVRFDY
jgi:3-dehydroquinate synthetase